MRQQYPKNGVFFQQDILKDESIDYRLRPPPPRTWANAPQGICNVTNVEIPFQKCVTPLSAPNDDYCVHSSGFLIKCPEKRNGERHIRNDERYINNNDKRYINR